MHPLDRPIWNALTTRQKHLSIGGARALRFAPEYGLFAAAADASAESLAALVSLIPKDGAIACLEADELPIPAGATVFQRAVCHQLTANRMASAVSPVEIVPLTDADASEMLASRHSLSPARFSRGPTNWAGSSG